ncbi:MAG: bifunctional DedA family/phosphatase PAP2 family protein [Legionella sp.]|nr:bifunctional DedA family/phosphatase PAP2 family protein [Legionella sp.]
MNLFADYIQPIIHWLHLNPGWSLFFTFIISLSESLAIIGAIVPGSVTMTAIGILAGSGVIRVDLTLLAATLGAICGDSLSYALGYVYSDKIHTVWPFKKHPNWLAYGKDFFSRHGGKSVLLGRFIGPLRAITPIIAGVMHMKQGRFLIANIISAIGWSILYVMPGVLIGAASTELSTESATRLFIIILALLALIWFLSILLRFLFLKITTYLKKNLHIFWASLKKHPVLYTFFNLVTPNNEDNHFTTAILLITSLFAMMLFIVATALQLEGNWIRGLNEPIHLLLRSFHSPSLQAFFIACTQLTSIFTMTCLLCICIVYFIYQKKFKMLVYLISTIICTATVALVFSLIIHSPAPQGLLGSKLGSSFPALDVTIATAFYSFIYFYVTTHYNFYTNVLQTLLFIVLGLSGLGAIFLGDHWFSDVIAGYAAGVLICLIHCLTFRKSNSEQTKKNPSPILFFTLLLAFFISAGLSTYIHYKTLTRSHTIYRKIHYISESNWWNQSTTFLPIYLHNRLGKTIGLLNIQYRGDLEKLEQSLSLNHWKSHNESFFTKFIQRINPQTSTVKLPLLDVLFENKHPDLMMTYEDTKLKIILELMIWESDYYFEDSKEPIWIGSLRVNNIPVVKSIHNPLQYVYPSLNEFNLKKIRLKTRLIDANHVHLAPYILLIKNK